jgi:tetratricopeptide (TPR) repeat protein
LVRLGIVELESEELGRAQEHLDEAFSLYEKLEDSRGRSQLLNALALTAARRADLAAARTYAQEALSVSQTIGDRGLESVAHTNLGSIANAREDYETATSHCAQALRIARQLGDPRAEAQALTELALAHLREGKKEAAWRRSLLAVELARASGDRAIEARALLVSGHAFTELEMTDQALDAYEQARQLQARLGQSGQMIESVAGLARVSLASGDLAEAQAFVEEILSRLKECGLAGVGEPLRVYLACYQVLEANHDPRARDVLITASGLYEETPPQ